MRMTIGNKDSHITIAVGENCKYIWIDLYFNGGYVGFIGPLTLDEIHAWRSSDCELMFTIKDATTFAVEAKFLKE